MPEAAISAMVRSLDSIQDRQASGLHLGVRCIYTDRRHLGLVSMIYPREPGALHRPDQYLLWKAVSSTRPTSVVKTARSAVDLIEDVGSVGAIVK